MHSIETCLRQLAKQNKFNLVGEQGGADWAENHSCWCECGVKIITWGKSFLSMGIQISSYGDQVYYW